ncbi:MAG: hypothetical protein WBM17_05410 [Anaerolineales bacterium]
MKKRKMDRRDVLRSAALVTAGAVMHGCSPARTGEPTLSQPVPPTTTRPITPVSTITATPMPTATSTPTRTALVQPAQVLFPARPLPDRFIGVYTSWWGGTQQEERDFIDDLVRRAPGLGASVLNLNFAWVALQPAETAFTFEHMQDLITRIKRGGMQCVLRVYGQMAEFQLWPEWLRPRLQDVYVCPGLFPAEVTNPTPWDAGYLQAYGGFLQQLGGWFREQADSIPDGYQISLGGVYGEMYLGCFTHYENYEEEIQNLTRGGTAAVDAHHAALADVIPDLILMSEELRPVTDHAVDLGIRWMQRNNGAKDTLYPEWGDKLVFLSQCPSNAFILEDESGWSRWKLPLQTRVDYLNQVVTQKGFRFQGVFLHPQDIIEGNRTAMAHLRDYLGGK